MMRACAVRESAMQMCIVCARVCVRVPGTWMDAFALMQLYGGVSQLYGRCYPIHAVHGTRTHTLSTPPHTQTHTALTHLQTHTLPAPQKDPAKNKTEQKQEAYKINLTLLFALIIQK